jgi:hypothetical protein
MGLLHSVRNDTRNWGQSPFFYKGSLSVIAKEKKDRGKKGPGPFFHVIASEAWQSHKETKKSFTIFWLLSLKCRMLRCDPSFSSFDIFYSPY